MALTFWMNAWTLILPTVFLSPLQWHHSPLNPPSGMKSRQITVKLPRAAQQLHFALDQHLNVSMSTSHHPLLNSLKGVWMVVYGTLWNFNPWIPPPHARVVHSEHQALIVAPRAILILTLRSGLQ